MIQAFAPLLAVIGLGVVLGLAWDRWLPTRGYPSTGALRRRIGQAVLYVLLPALVLRALARAPLGRELWGVPLVAALGCLGTLLAAWLVYDRWWLRRGLIDRRAAGAMLLAAAWANVTYLGLPVVAAILGPGLERVPVLFDVLALTPLLLTVGVAIGERYGTPSLTGHPGALRALLRLPPFWAACAGLGLRFGGVELPERLDRACALAGSLVPPLMLFSLGLALRPRGLRRLPLAGPALVLKLGLAPLLALALISAAGPFLGLEGDIARATLLEAAMPSMLLPLVISDRYRLDSELLALAIAASTLLGLVLLPLYGA